MTVIGEVRDAVRAMADLVAQTRVILQAIKDGTAYLQKNFPDAQGDLSELLEEMRTTVVGLISASRVVPDFAFTVDGSDLDRQPSRFNDHLVKSATTLSRLREDVSRLKGSCTDMIAIRDRLGERAGSAAWWTVLGISDKGQATAHKLQVAFGRLYEIDVTMTQQAGVVLNGTEQALERVRAAVLTGPDTSEMSVANVRRAAKVLHAQAVVLRPNFASWKTYAMTSATRFESSADGVRRAALTSRDRHALTDRIGAGFSARAAGRSAGASRAARPGCGRR